MPAKEKVYYVRSEKAKAKKVGEDMALYVKEQKAIHVLNQTALFIWESLREPVTFEELLFMLKEAFDIDRKDLEKDLKETVDLLLKYELVKKRA